MAIPWSQVSNKNRLFASGAGNPNVTPQQQQQNLQGMQNGTFDFQSTLGGTQSPTRGVGTQQYPGPPGSGPGGGSYFNPGGAAGGGSQPSYGSTVQIGGNAIQPKPVYSSSLTNQAMSQIGAENRQSGNLLYNMKQFDRPGVSRSAGSAYAAMGPASQYNVAADSGMANQFLDDTVANEQNMLMGQIARDRESQGLGNLLARSREGDHRKYLSDQRHLFDSLQNPSGLLARMLG